ncbi:MAG: phosphatidylglycerophosphatase A [Fretibacterium sp.]|nr:phosphatidylglycerophosphatase A [Fretibacterium sp.]
MKKKLSPAAWVATLCGLGFLTGAPGSLGSAVALVLYLFVPIPWPGIVAAAALGLWASQVSASELGAEDPAPIIIDEVVGMWVSLWALPVSFSLPAFFLFRILDILKPFPICTAEKLPGGLGIMADDVLGGVLCNLLLQSFNWVIWGRGWLRGLFS